MKFLSTISYVSLWSIFCAGCLINPSSISASEQTPASFFDPDRWFSNPVAGISSAVVLPDEIVLTQKGALTHRDKWGLQKLRFDIQFKKCVETGDPYLFVLQFAKVGRNSFYGETHHRGVMNDSYGLIFSREGRVFPVRFGKESEFETLGDTFAVFDPLKKNVVELQIKKVNDTYFFKLRTNDGSFVTFTDAAQFEPAGYVTLLNVSVGLETHLSDIHIKAKEMPAKEDAKPESVYFLEYFEDAASRLIHWRYNERTQDYSGVNVYENNTLLAHLRYPADQFIIPDAVASNELLVRTVDIDGDESDTAVVKLHRDETFMAGNDPQRIVVKGGEPYAQFTKNRTHEIFNVRGMNYVRLAFGDHSNFTAQNPYLPEFYDPYDSEAMLRLLKDQGYNTVRVFLAGRGVLNPGIGGYPDFNEPIYKPYLDNFIDFLAKAQKYGVYVLPTFGDGELPLNRYYKPFIKQMVEITHEEGQISSGIPFNSVYLTNAGIRGRTILMTETLEYIKERDPSLLKNVLAVQCQNELSLRANQWPFSLSSGQVTIANGQTYDMADADSRQRCMDEGLTYYHQTLIKAIKAVDSELLVAEGSFTLRIVGKDPIANKGLRVQGDGDQRFPPTALVMGQSGLDLIDIHIYHVNKDETPVAGYRNDMDSMLMYSDGMKAIRARVPVIMGEFGAFRFIEPSSQQAQANILATRDACLEDHLNGFMVWTLDTFEQQEMYHAMDGGIGFLSELSGR